MLAAGSAINFVISIDQEQMLVTKVDPATGTLTVQRGYNKTTPSTHAAGAYVSLQTPALPQPNNYAMYLTQSIQTGITTAGGKTITGLDSTASFVVGEQVTGPGIIAGTTISAIPSSTSITISSTATATATGVSLGFGTLATQPGNTTAGSNIISGLGGTASLVVGEQVTGPGITADTTISAIPSSTSITISSAATATATGVGLASGILEATLYSLGTSETPGQINFGDVLGQVNFAMPPSVANLELEGGPGNNGIKVDPSVNADVSLYGGPGLNTLMAGSGSDTLVAGSGTSLLIGGAGADTLYGGDLPQQDATPVLDPSETWSDEAGNTTDNNTTISLSTSGLALTQGQLVSGSGIPAGSTLVSWTPTTITISNPTTATAIGVTIAFGSSTPEGHDTLIAGSGNSELYAGSGGDVLIGCPATIQNGQWVLQPGAGRDLLEGGAGNDLLIAGAGSPGCVLMAGSGNDILVSENNGSNVMVGGGSGNDLFLGYAGSNDIDASGSAGNDTLVGGNGFNVLLGGNGTTDYLYDYPDHASWNEAVQQAAAAPFDVHLDSPFGPSSASQDPVWPLLNSLETDPQAFTATQQMSLSALLEQQLQALRVTDATGAQIEAQLYDLQTQSAYQGNITQLVGWIAEDPIAHGDLEQILGSLLDNPAVGLTHNQQYLWRNLLAGDLASDAAQELQVAQQIMDLAAVDYADSFIAGSETAAQFTFLANESYTLSAAEGLDSKLLGATNAADTLLAGNGTDYLYGNPALPTWMGGGGGKDTFYNPNGQDTVLGGEGNDNTLMFQGDGAFTLQPDTGLPAIDINLTTPQTATDGRSTSSWAAGNFSTATESIGNIQVIGVQTGNASGDTVVVNVQTLPAGLMGIYVQAGSGKGDVIDASQLEASAGAAAPATLLGGSGADTIRIGTHIGAGSVYQGNKLSELDIVGSPAGGDTVTVSNSYLNVDGVAINSQAGNTTSGSTTITGLANAYLLYVGQPITGNGIPSDSTVASVVSVNAITISNPATKTANGVTLTFGIIFNTIKLVGGSGTAATPLANIFQFGGSETKVMSGAGTNVFQADGSITNPDETVTNVVFEGGPDAYTTNDLLASWGTVTMIGGAGAMNIFKTTGGVDCTLIGGTGATNNFNATAGVNYTVTGGAGATNNFNIIEGANDTVTGGAGATNNFDLTGAGNYTLIGGAPSGQQRAAATPTTPAPLTSIDPDQTTTSLQGSARADFAATTVCNLAIFAGGYGTSAPSSAVNIYNAATGGWTTASLRGGARSGLAATTVGDLAIFAGGYSTSGLSTAVNIYNYATGGWTTASLQGGARDALAATTVGNLAIFAGGIDSSGFSSAVNIYNAATGGWTTASLQGGARDFLAATTVGNLAIFAGGYGSSGYSGAVDIYNYATGGWTTTSLPGVARDGLVATTVGDLAIFAGGYDTSGLSTAVDIYNCATGVWTTAALQGGARYGLAATTVGDLAIFAGGIGSSGYSGAVNIYNAATGVWTTASLPGGARDDLAATTVGNLAIFAGGYGDSGPSSAVNILSLPSATLTSATPTSLTPSAIAIPYTLADQNSAPCSIQVLYSVNGGAWYVARAGVDPSTGNLSPQTGLRSSPTGVPYTFYWNSLYDLGSSDNPAVCVEIVASDGTAYGPVSQTRSFTVDNTGVVNALTIAWADTNSDWVYLAQNGSTITLSGGTITTTTTTTTITGSATNMTSVAVNGGGARVAWTLREWSCQLP